MLGLRSLLYAFFMLPGRLFSPPVQALVATGGAPASFIGAVAALLWLTVLFANFSQALAEGRAKLGPKRCAARAS